MVRAIMPINDNRIVIKEIGLKASQMEKEFKNVDR
jgi:hypothetical protein